MPRKTQRGTSEKVNPHCPDHTAHSENAAEQSFPRGIPADATTEDYERIDAVAEREYLACEGH
jgi:hypothetical protein